MSGVTSNLIDFQTKKHFFQSKKQNKNFLNISWTQTQISENNSNIEKGLFHCQGHNVGVSGVTSSLMQGKITKYEQTLTMQR